MHGRMPRRWVATALIAAAALAVPLAVATYHHRMGHAHREADARFQVHATLLTGSHRPPSYHDGDTTTHRRVAARWTAPRGTLHDGVLLVPAGLTAGETHPTWVTHDGRAVPAPTTPETIARRAALAGLIYFTGLSIILVKALPAWRTRRAAQSLDADWKHVEPQWRRRYL
jgi:hypothetical protein